MQLTVNASREAARPAGPLRPGVVVEQGLVLPAPARRLTATGVELVQSTQYAGMDGSRWGAPGPVPLVALKTTLVRAFCAVDERLVRAGAALPPREGERVTAVLRVRRDGTEIFRTGPTNPAGVLLGYPGELDRELFDREEIYWTTGGDPRSEQFVQVRAIPPLEFVIPGWHCAAGTVVLDLDLDPGDPAGPTPWLGRVSFADVRVPPVAVVPRPGTGPADLAATVALAERMLPVPYLDYRLLAAHPGDLPVFRVLNRLFGRGDLVLELPDGADAFARALAEAFGGRPTDPASIGEVGIDVATRTMYRPGSATDVMSGGGRRWISPDTYTGILSALAAEPDVPPESRRLLVLRLRPQRDRTVEVGAAVPIAATGPLPRPAGPSPLSVDVLDAAGVVLASHRLGVDLTGAVEWGEDAAGLAVHASGAPLARIAAGEAPEVDLSEPRVRSGAVHAVWVTRHPRAMPHVVVLWSADDGATWQPVAVTGGTHGAVELPTDAVPGGARCRLRVLASAELTAAEAVSAPFAVPVTPRAPTIVAPTDGATLPAGDPVALAGSAYSPDFGLCRPEELAWESDVDGPLGHGRQVAVPLRSGEHRITATAPDGTGRRCTATARVTLRG